MPDCPPEIIGSQLPVPPELELLDELLLELLLEDDELLLEDDELLLDDELELLDVDEEPPLTTP